MIEKVSIIAILVVTFNPISYADTLRSGEDMASCNADLIDSISFLKSNWHSR